jgi:tRNA U38,U39,U40 pseudouridine synthase TruA
MIAQIYCLKNSSDEDSAPLSIPGKSIGHPISPSDSNFKPLPFDSDLTKLTFTLNKMLPPDVRVIGASPTPVLTGFSQNRPFHPSLDAMKKTYQYTFSVGELHDPIRRRYVYWKQ